jgi:hypothetical protein
MQFIKKHYRVVAAAVLVLLVWLTFFAVRETEFALITQFGQPVRTITTAGLHAKWPFQNITYFDRRLRVYDPRPSEFLTRDKKNLVIEKLCRVARPRPEAFRRDGRRSGLCRNAFARCSVVRFIRRFGYSRSGFHRGRRCGRHAIGRISRSVDCIDRQLRLGANTGLRSWMCGSSG